jgi:5'-nucleotidase
MWRRTRLGVLWGALALGCTDATVREPEQGTEPRLTLLHTSDIHSRLWPFRARISSFEASLGLGRAGELEELGGVARLATLLEAERRRGPALWLDSGDALEGAAVFRRYRGRLELELLSSLGMAAMALGNHELSLPGPELAELLASSTRFPVLASNLRPSAGSSLEGLLVSSTLIFAAGFRIGVIGVANPESPPNLARAANPWSLVRAPVLAAAVQASIDEISSRASLIVVLSHLGLDADHELVRGLTGVDLVLGGHQHILTAEPEWEDDCASAGLQQTRGCSPRRVAIVHSGAYSEWLSRLDLTLTADSAQPGALEISQIALKHLPVAATVPPEPQVFGYLEERRPPPEPPLAFLTLALARRSALGGDSALGNLTADAMLAASGADVALLNSSGLRADVEAGALLQSDLELAFPFDEPWRLAWLSVRSLQRSLVLAAERSATRGCESALQVAGLRLKIRCGACRARRNDCLELSRAPWDVATPFRDDERVLVALPAYLTLPGADFEDAANGSELTVSVPTALSRRLQASPLQTEVEACAAALVSWSRSRCQEAFGALGCPLDFRRASASCSRLPSFEGQRDDRIQMLP